MCGKYNRYIDLVALGGLRPWNLQSMPDFIALRVAVPLTNGKRNSKLHYVPQIDIYSFGGTVSKKALA
jgi:hypothetical protein